MYVLSYSEDQKTWRYRCVIMFSLNLLHDAFPHGSKFTAKYRLPETLLLWNVNAWLRWLCISILAEFGISLISNHSFQKVYTSKHVLTLSFKVTRGCVMLMHENGVCRESYEWPTPIFSQMVRNIVTDIICKNYPNRRWRVFCYLNFSVLIQGQMHFKVTSI